MGDSILIPVDFNRWLRAQRKRLGVSLRELERVSGVDHSSISRLVSTDREPALSTAVSLVRAIEKLQVHDRGSAAKLEHELPDREGPPPRRRKPPADGQESRGVELPARRQRARAQGGPL